MADKRAGVLVVLLVYGIILLGANLEGAFVEACPQYCVDAAYVTCESSGNTKLTPSCTNCCFLAGKGCTIYYNDGTSQACPT
ncbi:hypothetical protein NMG60_11022003 [Bertholletia excelsa]